MFIALISQLSVTDKNGRTMGWGDMGNDAKWSEVKVQSKVNVWSEMNVQSGAKA